MQELFQGGYGETNRQLSPPDLVGKVFELHRDTLFIMQLQQQGMESTRGQDKLQDPSWHGTSIDLRQKDNLGVFVVALNLAFITKQPKVSRLQDHLPEAHDNHGMHQRSFHGDLQTESSKVLSDMNVALLTRKQILGNTVTIAIHLLKSKSTGE